MRPGADKVAVTAAQAAISTRRARQDLVAIAEDNFKIRVSD